MVDVISHMGENQKLGEVQARIRGFCEEVGIEGFGKTREEGVSCDVLGQDLGRENGETPEDCGDEFLVGLFHRHSGEHVWVRLADVLELAMLAKVGPGEGGALSESMELLSGGVITREGRGEVSLY